MKFTLRLFICLYFYSSTSLAVSLLERIEMISNRVEKKNPDVLADLEGQSVKLTIAAFKKEKIIEVWQTKPYLRKMVTYPFTKSSGTLGPKNRQGDKQIPEGVYSIPLINPNSKYYLSIRINYPNALDKKRAQQNGIKDPGSDIYIHGKKKTVGCIPIGDKNIEELFYIVYKAGIKNIEVVIAPSKSTDPNFKSLGINKNDKLALKKYQKIKLALKKIDQ